MPPTIPFFSPERASHKGHIGYQGSPGDWYAAGIGMLAPIMFITLRIVQGLDASLLGGREAAVVTRAKRKDFGTEQPVSVNGRMRLPDTPGFGVELNPDAPAGATDRALTS